MRTQSTTFVRASISFPPDIHQILEILAKQKKVSMAWVVREAAEKYVAEKRSGGEVGRKRMPAREFHGNVMSCLDAVKATDETLAILSDGSTKVIGTICSN